MAKRKNRPRPITPLDADIKAERKAMPNSVYSSELERLQIELVKLQE